VLLLSHYLLLLLYLLYLCLIRLLRVHTRIDSRGNLSCWRDAALGITIIEHGGNVGRRVVLEFHVQLVELGSIEIKVVEVAERNIQGFSWDDEIVPWSVM